MENPITFLRRLFLRVSSVTPRSNSVVYITNDESAEANPEQNLPTEETETLSNLPTVELLIEAVEKNGLHRVRQILSENPRLINEKDSENRVPILLASEDPDKIQILEYMIKNFGVDVCDSDKETPLMAAARYNNEEAIKLLSKHGADIAAINSNGEDAMKIAISWRNYDSMCLIFRAGLQRQKRDDGKSWNAVAEALKTMSLSTTKTFINTLGLEILRDVSVAFLDKEHPFRKFITKDLNEEEIAKYERNIPETRINFGLSPNTVMSEANTSSLSSNTRTQLIT